ncbi:unnamed protein product [Agarophyton chilense]
MGFNSTAFSLSTRMVFSQSQPCALRCRTRATASGTPNTSTDETGVNVKRYKSQRSIISADKRELDAREVNSLMVKAGKQSRDIDKWQKALDGSFAVVYARLIADRKLVGFARATSDHALNGTIWDVVTDPDLPDEGLMKRNIVKYILKELRRTVPGCSIALFSVEGDKRFFEELDFVADPDGIRGMALFDEMKPKHL